MPLLRPPGRAESHTFEYKRNGTLSPFAARYTAAREVLSETTARHTSAKVVVIVSVVLASELRAAKKSRDLQQREQQKNQLVAAFLADHRNSQVHFTPPYSS